MKEYWAVLLDSETREMLLRDFPPVHSKTFAEHVTLCFDPTPEQDEYWKGRQGERVDLTGVGHAHDTKGQAVVVNGIELSDNRIPHVTISCSNDVGPVYSNELLKNGYEILWSFSVTGVIAKHTRDGWE